MSVQKKPERSWEERKAALFNEKKNGYDQIDDQTKARMEDYCEGYKRFLDMAKTEREAVETVVGLDIKNTPFCT